MFRSVRYVLILFFLFAKPSLSETNVYIYLTVNEEIVTNYDIEKEVRYLEILNPNLASLDKENKFEIGKTSMINEIIKKKEINKIFDLEENNQFVDENFQSLYSKLGFDNEKDFQKELKKKLNYNIGEIKQKLKIEILWNELIYYKFKNQIEIDKKKLRSKVENLNNKLKKEYFLSEIIFEKEINEELDSLINKIKTSISEIGFNNTANIYSISDTSKLGGKLGWIDENNLSELIFNELKKIDKGQFSNVIKIRNNFMILKIEDIRTNEISINKKEELDKMIKFETNKQLNQFSRIYFEKSKMNYIINEK